MAREHVNALVNGAAIAEYRIEGLLGHGGFGMTYLARDQHLNALVAIKEYLPQEFAVRAANSTIVPKSEGDAQGYEWGLERFKQEARALARFKHPNIVRCARLIEANNTAYMVMDYEQGMALADYLKRERTTLDEARLLGVFLPVLDGLSALHAAELVHRDIKPGNLYLRAGGAPMLIDFGAVRHAIGAHSRSLTAVVTPGFAPIEQYSSEGKQGPWTDLYAVGATMYTCILGRSPIDAARRSAAISDGDPDPLVSAARVGKGKYSDQLLAAIDWAMQFRSKDRPQSAAELKAALRRSPVAPAPLDLGAEAEPRTVAADAAALADRLGGETARSAPTPTPTPASAPEGTQRLPPLPPPPSPPPAAGPAARGRALPLIGGALLALATAAAAYWFVELRAEQREARLWQTAQQADTLDAYRSYLAVCERCAQRAEAEQRMQALERRRGGEALDGAALQRVADLKLAFAQQLLGGAIDAPPGDNARATLAELQRLVPADPFVASARAQLAKHDQAVAKAVSRSDAKPRTTGPAPVAAAPPPTFAPVQGSTIKPLATAPEPAATGAAPAASPATAAVVVPMAPARDALAAPAPDAASAPAGAPARSGELVVGPRRAPATAQKPQATPSAPQGSVLAPQGSGLKSVEPAPSGAAPRASAPLATISNSRVAGEVLRIPLSGRAQAPPLVLLPGGAFRFGDVAGGGEADEQPVTSARVAAFAIGLREVTRGEFKLFAERADHRTDAETAGGCLVERRGTVVRDGNLNWRRVPADQGDDHPVTCVSYRDAAAYAAWLRKTTRRDFRLPTEREWEYAARGGSEAAWWWGAQPAEGGANCIGCGARSAGRPLATASLLPNPFGLHDVAGNVAEWTCTPYAPRPGDGGDACPDLRLGQRGAGAMPTIVVRGGSFATGFVALRSSARRGVPADAPRADLGFRVALDP